MPTRTVNFLTPVILLTRGQKNLPTLLGSNTDFQDEKNGADFLPRFYISDYFAASVKPRASSNGPTSGPRP
ncbi:hypothetical protein SAMN04515618_102235 [Collimonas sp. OK307]|nr:hypothetical protein SAMN04515618_102235 [Collimonas sp. OK307]